jgi:DNA (cytosine-5)-methyltransferase 1
LAKRGPGFPQLSPDEEHGSAFHKILNDIEKICKDIGYCVSWGVLNSADYGSPQARERVIFIGSLDGHFVWPGPTHSRNGENGKKKWATLKDGLKGLKEKRPQYLEFNNKVYNYLKLVPEGNNWRSLPKKLRSKAVGSAYKSWGGRCGFLRRLSWNRPSPTITNNPKTKATMLCHPTKIRPLSVRECARLQQFPDYWNFAGSIAAQYRQVGNATPLALGHAIGIAIRNAAKKRGKGLYRHKLYCADPQLLEKIINRPKTMLNPLRMRKNKSIEQAAKWLNGSANKRTFFKKYQAINAA